jgi:type IV pilus assembly PilX-like protein
MTITSTIRTLINERGAAVVIALLLTVLLALLGAGLLTLANTETSIAASYRHGQEASYGAEAALERALADLGAVADWTTVLAAPPGNVVSTFDDGQASVRLPDGRAVSLASVTMERQQASDELTGPAMYGADSPRWRLFAHAALGDLAPSPAPGVSLYLVVWVADDGADGDGDPSRDANGRIHVHAEAFGAGGARREVTAAIERVPTGVIRRLSWHRR